MQKNLGFGLGLRAKHYEYILENKPDLDWFEIISENFMEVHSGYIGFLNEIKMNYPIVMHGVGLSIGGAKALNTEYLKKLKTLSEKLDVPWISDHLCFTEAHGFQSHDLLPIPYTDDALKHLIPRIKQVQNFLEKPFALENPSTYVAYKMSTYTEWDFLKKLYEETGVGLLLDVNNVYVSARNFGFDPNEYIEAIPSEAIVQIHLAGHEDRITHVIDTHDHPVADPVWDLYADTIKSKGSIPTMIEWDESIPEFEVLMEELGKAKEIATAVCGKGREKVA